MKDFRDNELKIGDEIVYKKSSLSRTRDIMFVGEIIDFTPKMIKVKRTYTSEPRAFSLGDIEIVSPNNVCKLNSEQENDATLADNVFEELGYEKILEHNFEKSKYDCAEMLIEYRLRENMTEIIFWSDKTFGKDYCYDNDERTFTMQELQAINKKCEELGWVK